jgi:hypothetical protein
VFDAAIRLCFNKTAIQFLSSKKVIPFNPIYMNNSKKILVRIRFWREYHREITAANNRRSLEADRSLRYRYAPFEEVRRRG